MTYPAGRWPALLLTLCLTAAGVVLRRLQLAMAYDSAGLPIPGVHPTTLGLLAVTIAAAALLPLALRPLPDRPACADNFSPRHLAPSTLLGALALLLGALAKPVQDPTRLLFWLTALPTVACALSVAASAVLRRRGAPPNPGLEGLPCFTIAILLVLGFKGRWSTNPVMVDYLFALFALVCALVATYDLVGFAFDRGRRRHTAYWCLMTFYFCAVACVGDDQIAVLIWVGLGLWLGGCGWALLAPGKATEST